MLGRFNLNGADRRAAVSHAEAIRHISDLSHEGPFHVVNFDAHHDLGYSPQQTRAAEEGDVDCGSWLYAALHHEFASKVTVVFPDWLSNRKIPDIDNAEAVPFSKLPEITGEVAGLFIARSDSWAPPYLDDQFTGMCEQAEVDFDGEPWRSRQT